MDRPVFIVKDIKRESRKKYSKYIVTRWNGEVEVLTLEEIRERNYVKGRVW